MSYIFDRSDWPTIVIATEKDHKIPYGTYPTLRALDDGRGELVIPYGVTSVDETPLLVHQNIDLARNLREMLAIARRLVRTTTDEALR